MNRILEYSYATIVGIGGPPFCISSELDIDEFRVGWAVQECNGCWGGMYGVSGGRAEGRGSPRFTPHAHELS